MPALGECYEKFTVPSNEKITGAQSSANDESMIITTQHTTTNQSYLYSYSQSINEEDSKCNCNGGMCFQPGWGFNCLSCG